MATFGDALNLPYAKLRKQEYVAFIMVQVCGSGKADCPIARFGFILVCVSEWASSKVLACVSWLIEVVYFAKIPQFSSTAFERVDQVESVLTT